MSTGGFRPYHVNDLVSNITDSLNIQFREILVESLPLCLLLFWIVLLVGTVGSLDQTEIRCCLQRDQHNSSIMKPRCMYCYVVEGLRIRARIVLLKEAGHSCVVGGRSLVHIV